ncbi:expressed protein [Phakopsora pachyrhizi]|uniref:Expressed protein n=1 Tax=Phakopsora pachyrhizi TaxID=170000 RepID=A0AAV0BJD6_PHAPC|nr:expressed protein [Phakopsora pachyrhizi]
MKLLIIALSFCVLKYSSNAMEISTSSRNLSQGRDVLNEIDKSLKPIDYGKSVSIPKDGIQRMGHVDWTNYQLDELKSYIDHNGLSNVEGVLMRFDRIRVHYKEIKKYLEEYLEKYGMQGSPYTTYLSQDFKTRIANAIRTFEIFITNIDRLEQTLKYKLTGYIFLEENPKVVESNDQVELALSTNNNYKKNRKTLEYELQLARKQVREAINQRDINQALIDKETLGKLNIIKEKNN